MKPRTLNELYKILADDIKDKVYFYICSRIAHLCNIKVITLDEGKLLLYHFKMNKPNQFEHIGFFYHNSFKGSYSWWELDSEGDNQRKLFIEYLIRLTEKETYVKNN